MSSNKFVAIKLSSVLLDNLSKLIKELENKDPSFKGSSREYLHMTLVFCGEKLNRLKKEQKASFEKYIESINTEGFKIEFTNPRLIRFPPGKLNLYAVEYTIKTDSLYQKIKKDLEIYLDETAYEKWQPHITLGKTRDLKFNLEQHQKIDNLKFTSSHIDIIG